MIGGPWSSFPMVKGTRIARIRAVGGETPPAAFSCALTYNRMSRLLCAVFARIVERYFAYVKTALCPAPGSRESGPWANIPDKSTKASKRPSVGHYRRFKRHQRLVAGHEVKGRPRSMRHPQRMAFLWSCLSMRKNAVAHAYRVPEKYDQRGST